MKTGFMGTHPKHLSKALLTLCMLDNFACFFFLSSVDFFFFKLIFQKNPTEIASECQTVWIQIRPEVLSGLIWVQTICKGYK